MTSLAMAVSVDSRGPCGLYIITDSRLTWDAKAIQRWDSAQKTFASSRTPDIFGFCGDAFFPPMILRQFLDQVNFGLLLPDGMDSEGRHAALRMKLTQALEQRTSAPIRPFSVFHGARDGEFMQSRFRVWETRYDVHSRSWSDQEHDLLTDHSYFAHLDGSGRNYIIERGKEWLATDAKGTSRAAMWSFCNALHEGKDPRSGGAPQLVGIWRKGAAQVFGFWWRGAPYVSGSPVPVGSNFARISWFNHRFERCDGSTGKRLADAQKHTRPKPAE